MGIKDLARMMTVTQLRQYYYAHKADLALMVKRKAPEKEQAFSKGRMQAMLDELARRGETLVHDEEPLDV